jgi:hypothetical protein
MDKKGKRRGPKPQGLHNTGFRPKATHWDTMREFARSRNLTGTQVLRQVMARLDTPEKLARFLTSPDPEICNAGSREDGSTGGPGEAIQNTATQDPKTCNAGRPNG